MPVKSPLEIYNLYEGHQNYYVNIEGKKLKYCNRVGIDYVTKDHNEDYCFSKGYYEKSNCNHILKHFIGCEKIRETRKKLLNFDDVNYMHQCVDGIPFVDCPSFEKHQDSNLCNRVFYCDFPRSLFGSFFKVNGSITRKYDKITKKYTFDIVNYNRVFVGDIFYIEEKRKQHVIDVKLEKETKKMFKEEKIKFEELSEIFKFN
jgi:hypothetical protein